MSKKQTEKALKSPSRVANLRDALVKHYGTRVRKNYPVGTRYGRLTVTDYERRSNGCWAVLCRCDCGKDKKVLIPNFMRRGLVQSCGCLNSEMSSARFKQSRHANVYKLPEGQASFNALYRVYQKNATLRGFAFEIPRHDFEQLTKQVCSYCGKKPAQSLTNGGYNGIYVYNGLDRIDSASGYILGNVVTCCKTCNRAKRDMTHDAFVDWLKQVFVHLKF